MTRWHNQYIDGYVHFCTLTITNWETLLKDETINVLYNVWNESRNKLGVKVLAYVIMPNHFHILIYGKTGKSIMQFMQRSASLTSKCILSGGSLWKERPRVLPVYSSALIKTKINYIHHNPVRKGLVDNPSEWIHSSFHQFYISRDEAPFICDMIDGIDLL